MPILQQDTPYPVEREIVFLKESGGAYPGVIPRTIRPKALEGVLSPDASQASGLRAVTASLRYGQRSFLPALGITFWGADAKGTPVEITADTASPEILRAGFMLLKEAGTPDPLDIAARDADEDHRYWQAIYLPHCTVVGWDDLGMALDDHVGSDPEEEEWSPSLGEVFGPAYALEPKSNHERMIALSNIGADLAFHTRLINLETGFLFTLKE